MVILIIGILAAIALPSFLGQKGKAYDADAKNNAKNASSLMEACYLSTPPPQRYNHASCASALVINSASNLVHGTAVGQVYVSAVGANTYTVAARSKAGTGTQYFKLSKTATGETFRCKSTAPTVACATNTW